MLHLSGLWQRPSQWGQQSGLELSRRGINEFAIENAAYVWPCCQWLRDNCSLEWLSDTGELYPLCFCWGGKTSARTARYMRDARTTPTQAYTRTRVHTVISGGAGLPSLCAAARVEARVTAASRCKARHGRGSSAVSLSLSHSVPSLTHPSFSGLIARSVSFL